MSLSTTDRAIKRAFDIIASASGLWATGPLIAVAWALATVDTGKNGFFTQERIGQGGARFRVIKIRTMREVEGFYTIATASDDPRITRLGKLLRKLKIDELPQLFNVLRGEMSFVGPRPDVPGFADCLEGEDRVILSIRPGITGPATLHFRNEEELLAEQEDPERYNIEVIFPEKVRLNRQYVESYSFWKDIGYIFETILG